MTDDHTVAWSKLLIFEISFVQEVGFAPALMRYPMAAWLVHPLVLPIAFATGFVGYMLYQTFA